LTSLGRLLDLTPVVTEPPKPPEGAASSTPRSFDAETRPLVEEALRKLGLSGDLCRARSTKTVEGHQQTSWTLKRGSAAILVSLVERDAKAGEVVLRALSPVLKPAADKEAALFAHLLDLNAAGLGPCAFGRVGDLVVLVSERPAHDLSALEIEHIVRHLAAVADAFDDKLVAEFGGSRASDPHH
jgi:hypothetical protein